VGGLGYALVYVPLGLIIELRTGFTGRCLRIAGRVQRRMERVPRDLRKAASRARGRIRTRPLTRFGTNLRRTLVRRGRDGRRIVTRASRLVRRVRRLVPVGLQLVRRSLPR
jgi:hypothetical protein